MMPNMAGVLSRFNETVRLRLVNKTLTDFEAVETDAQRAPVFIEGVLQPTPARELLIKPEGERTWKWWTFYTTEDIPLDSVIVDPGNVQMRVLRRSNWRAGFFVYELAEGPGL